MTTMIKCALLDYVTSVLRKSSFTIAYSQSFHACKVEKDIQSIYVSQNISYVEACKQVFPFHLKKTFLAAVKTMNINFINIQIEISCPPAEFFAECG